MRKVILIIQLLLVYCVLSAAPVNERMARDIAINFFNAQTKSAAVEIELEWAGNDMSDVSTTKSAELDNALIYIYNRTDDKGFVIISGDDNVRPIIAFSYDNSFDVENMSEGARVMLNSWCKQVEAARSRQDSEWYQKSASSVGVVIEEYATAQWGQGDPFNREAPVIDGKRAVTGCVATAMSIIAAYNKWPEKGSGTVPAYSYTINGTTYNVQENVLGREYDYSNMLANYNGGYSDVQANAVAALMYDMGTSVEMSYHYTESGAVASLAPKALVNYFGYSKQALMLYRESYTQDEWVSMLQTNLSTYGPTFFRGTDASGGGHAFVLDGYTDGGYFKINFGWEGVSNGYYLLPEIDYYNGQAAAFYLTPDKEGNSTYQDNLLIGPFTYYGNPDIHSSGIYAPSVLEYKTGEPFEIRLGAIHNQGMAPFTGSVLIALCNDQGNIKENLSEIGFDSLQSGYYSYFPYNISVTINGTIEEGDRIRLYYKGGYSNDTWKWMNKYNSETINEIVLWNTPDQVAESMSFNFDKRTGIFSVNSYNAIEYTVTDSSSTTLTSGNVPSFTDISIDMSDYESGTYTLSFSSGGDPYILMIHL